MHPPDPHSTPSWLVPITAGALTTFVGLFALGGLSGGGDGMLGLAAACCCAFSFVPFGALPTWIAARRDPLLTPGQGFAVAFIAVGLGALVWAGLSSTLAAGVDDGELRRQLLEAMPPENQLSEEDAQRLVDCVAGAYPYMPVVVATVTTLLAGFVGMMTVGLARRRGPRDPGLAE